MKTNYYIGIPVKNDEKRYYFLCTDTVIGDYFLESDKFHAIAFSSENSARDWMKNNLPWLYLAEVEKERFAWDKYCILKETWEVIES